MRWELILFGGASMLVSFGCLVPNKWLPTLPNDKLLHFSAFAGLTLLATRIASDRTSLAFWLLGLLVAGWVIECLQNCVPGRGFSWRDMAANAAGIVAAALLSHFLAGA